MENGKLTFRILERIKMTIVCQKFYYVNIMAERE